MLGTTLGWSAARASRKIRGAMNGWMNVGQVRKWWMLKLDRITEDVEERRGIQLEGGKNPTEQHPRSSSVLSGRCCERIADEISRSPAKWTFFETFSAPKLAGRSILLDESQQGFLAFLSFLRGEWTSGVMIVSCKLLKIKLSSRVWRKLYRVLRI